MKAYRFTITLKAQTQEEATNIQDVIQLLLREENRATLLDMAPKAKVMNSIFEIMEDMETSILKTA
jgi:hypothetical protein